MISELADFGFGPQARNRLSDATDPGHSGAIAALETFYYALNNADLKILASTWSPSPLAQLNNPLGGVGEQWNWHTLRDAPWPATGGV